VLIQDDECWFAAGRSSYLDGGIRIYALDPTTGKVLQSKTIYYPDPETGKAPTETSAQLIAGLLNDIPATDGDNVFIRQMKVSSSEGRDRYHLFTTGGYLDPSWFNRTFWQVGQARTSGLMVLGNDVAYGAEVYDSRSRETVFTPGSRAYRLQCLPLKISAGDKRAARKRRHGPKPVWEKRIGIRVTAMIRTGHTIFAAGSPDIVDPQDPHGAWEGRKGGILAAFSTEDGKKLAEYELPAPPAWDGMAAANDRLFISTMDGYVLCMDENQQKILMSYRYD
jgi:outer membrane protein assembly factor BamB